jgi:protein gp37
MSHTKIQWTDATWNPVTGCTKFSPGCQHCYAERMARRLQGMGQANYSNGFDLTVHEHELGRPLKWKKPRRVFVCSMGDLFHESVPFSFLQQVFGVMERAQRHQFQVLTKRVAGFWKLAKYLPWPGNVWMGTSVECARYLWRIDELRGTPAVVKFLSLEPLLEPLPDLDLRGIDWVIVGGESGPGARVCDVEWIRTVIQQCDEAKIPVFVKQLGTRIRWGRFGGDEGTAYQSRCAGGISHPKGGNQEEWPEDLRVRQWPRSA